jgi:hypothetical protein
VLCACACAFCCACAGVSGDVIGVNVLLALVVGGGVRVRDRERGDADRAPPGVTTEMPDAELECWSATGVGSWELELGEELKVGRDVRELERWERGEGWMTGGEEEREEAASCDWFWKGKGFGLWLESWSDICDRGSDTSQLGVGRFPVLVRGRLVGLWLS